MDRMTEWNEELGSYLPIYINIKDNIDWDLINYIGQLEDKIEREEYKNDINE